MSNLPPGVTTGMLPGNTREDAIAEARMERIYEALDGLGLTEDQIDAIAEKVNPLLVDAYQVGFSDGTAEEKMMAGIAADSYKRAAVAQGRAALGDDPDKAQTPSGEAVAKLS
jgi:hypothetical protein